LRENNWEHIDKKEIAAAAEKKALQNKRQPTKDTKNFIQKLFGAYSDVKNKEDAKKGQGDPNYFEFNIDNYIIKNVAIPNYLETDINQNPELIDPNLDFYLKTKAIYMADEEIEGHLLL
jgi:hypothetical protein